MVDHACDLLTNGIVQYLIQELINVITTDFVAVNLLLAS